MAPTTIVNPLAPGARHLVVSSTPKTHRVSTFLALAGIVLVAFNLRIATVAPSPIYGVIGKSFAISPTWHGLMGTLPLVCFGLFGTLTPWLNRKVGLERGMILAMLLIATGELARAALSKSIGFFAACSLLSLGGMGIGNVLVLPAIRHYFPEQVSLITGIYLVLITVSASLPSFVAVPVAEALGWRFSIGLWSAVAALASLPWFALKQPHAAPAQAAPPRTYAAWRWPITWAIVALFSVGALVMYALIAWLPTLLTTTAGKSAATAGVMLAVYNISGLPHSLVIPFIMSRMKRPFLVVLFGGLCTIVGALGFAYAPAYDWYWLFPAGLGALLIPAGLALVNMRSRTEEGTAALSGFVQGAGYFIAAVGPLVVGYLHTRSGDWVAACWFLALAGVVSIIAGFFAVRPVFIEDMA